MTQEQARQELKLLGFTFKKTEYGEYRINRIGGIEETAYYTDDLQDAVGTAKFQTEMGA